ncbi:MAG: ABC transporter substrate-binding protein, partial [Caldilinea sp.]
MKSYRLLLGVMLFTLLLGACAAPPAEEMPAAAEQSMPVSAEGPCTSYQESPMLTEKVVAGELPPTAERLPLNPLVVQPYEGIGQYGGEYLGLYDGVRLAEFRAFGYEGLVRWSVDGSEVIPNIAEGWEISEDGTTYTFKLREGMRWSDGELFTADDILFWWEQVETNKEIYPNPYPYFVVDGQPATVTKIDDLTVEFKFAVPNGLFLTTLA